MILHILELRRGIELKVGVVSSYCDYMST